MTVDQLLDLYVNVGIDQEEALDRDAYSRKALQRLYNHPNIQVRLKAATRTLAAAPLAARAVLQTIYESKLYPQAGDAGMTLRALDDGTFKPE